VSGGEFGLGYFAENKKFQDELMFRYQDFIDELPCQSLPPFYVGILETQRYIG